MSKAIKTFIILNLVAGIALAVMGTLLFMEKDLIKGRALLLRHTVTNLAENLKWGEQLAEFKVEEKQSRAFVLPKPVAHEQIASYEKSLDDLTSFATGRLGQLGGTHTILVSTQNTLEKTKETLATRERELSEARSTIASLETDIQNTQDELARTNGTIATLRNNIASLQTNLDNLNADLVSRNNQIATLEIDLNTAIEERDIALERYKICKMGSGDGDGSSGNWRGRTAQILEVNPRWDYVIIDKGQIDELTPDVQAYVHRGNEYVGKLKVTTVKQGVSIARILPGSVADGMTIEPGDTLFF